MRKRQEISYDQISPALATSASVDVPVTHVVYLDKRTARKVQPSRMPTPSPKKKTKKTPEHTTGKIEWMSQHPKTTALGAIALFALGSHVYAGNYEEVKADNCTDTTHQQVVIPSTLGNSESYKDFVRGIEDAFGKAAPAKKNGIYPKSSDGLIDTLMQQRGYIMGKAQFDSMNRNLTSQDGTPLYSSDENGTVQNEFENAGIYCVDVPAPIRNGSHLTMDDDTTIEEAAEGYNIPVSQIRGLNPHLEGYEDDEELPEGASFAITRKQGDFVLQAVSPDSLDDYLSSNQKDGSYDRETWDKASWASRAYTGITNTFGNDNVAFAPYVVSNDKDKNLPVSNGSFFEAHEDITPADIMKAYPATPLSLPNLEQSQELQDRNTYLDAIRDNDFDSNDHTEIDAEQVHSLTSEELQKIKEFTPTYVNSAKKYDLPWQMLAAIHVRESSLSMINPSNGQGIFQFYGGGDYFPPGEASVENFQDQVDELARRLRNDYIGRGEAIAHLPLTASVVDPKKVKDVFFSYNGRADAYIAQAIALGYDRVHAAEGSPYVMNLADSDRTNSSNEEWGQILTDGGSLGPANDRPGAWVIYNELAKASGADEYINIPIGYAGQLSYDSPQAGKITSFTDSNVPIPQTIGDVVYFSQWDRRWYDTPYNPPGVDGRTIASSGCGPTSLAMVISTLTNNAVNPEEMASWAQENGYRYDGGTNHEAFVQAPKEFGLNSQKIDLTLETIKSITDEGGLVIINGNDTDTTTPATSSGHIYTIYDVSKDGRLYVADPNSVEKSLRTWAPSEILRPAWAAYGIYT